MGRHLVRSPGDSLDIRFASEVGTVLRDGAPNPWGLSRAPGRVWELSDVVGQPAGESLGGVGQNPTQVGIPNDEPTLRLVSSDERLDVLHKLHVIFKDAVRCRPVYGERAALSSSGLERS